MSIIEKLTEGMVQRDLQAEGSALLGKWERTGLLEGISSERNKHTMARLLENQAKELLRESNSMAGGDVEGFAAVAFPIVRRVFAGLIANDLVSVQPMSLPSGLIFFLDFKVSDSNGAPRLGYGANDSLYGGGVLGQQITGGVSLTGVNAEKGFYNMNNGYTSPTGSFVISSVSSVHGPAIFGATETGDKLVRFDPDFVSGTTYFQVLDLTMADLTLFNKQDLVAAVLSGTAVNLSSSIQVRRLTTRPSENVLRVVVSKESIFTSVAVGVAASSLTAPVIDPFGTAVQAGSTNVTSIRSYLLP